MDVAFAALLIASAGLLLHFKVHLWQKHHQATLREERAEMREEQAEVSKIYTESDGPHGYDRLKAKVVNTGNCPLYIAAVTVNGPSIEHGRIPLFPETGSAQQPIRPNGAARIYQFPLDEVDVDDTLDEVAVTAIICGSTLEDAWVIVVSNRKEIAREPVPFPLPVYHEPALDMPDPVP